MRRSIKKEQASIHKEFLELQLDRICVSISLRVGVPQHVVYQRDEQRSHRWGAMETNNGGKFSTAL